VRRAVRVGLAVVVFAGCAGAPGDEGVGADQPEWTRPVSGWPYSIAADDDLAVVVAGVVTGLDPRDGSVRWESDVPGAWLHRPALSDRTALVSGGDRFVALERTTGAARWAVDAPEAGPVALVTEPSGTEVAVLATEGGTLTARDATSGRLRWSRHHDGELWSPPAVDDDGTLVATVWSGLDDPRLRVVDLGTGRVEWEVPVDPSVSAPVLADGGVFVAQGDGNFAGQVVAYALADGEELWRAPLPAPVQSGTVPAAHDGQVAVIDRMGSVSMLDATTGAVTWQRDLRRPVLHTRVLLTSSAVVVTDEPGEVVVLDRGDGGVVERVRPDGYPVGLAEAGDRLLVALRLTHPGRVEAWHRP
jgi:outer membrane protein assembly factor BamB